jgi:acetolactate decarboxylase
MLRKNRRTLILALALALSLAAAPLWAAEQQRLFQVSTLQALMAGVFDGGLTFQALARQGDFGLGTFEALDGEMIALDGVFYQIRADGRVYPVTGRQKTPFAEVTFFKAGKTVRLPQPVNFQQLTDYLSDLLPSPNLLYAIKIEGFFPYVKTRSVPRQSKPYPPLSEAVKGQSVFELTKVRGVIVAFRHPAFLAGINMAGYHCHFITADRRAGGHLLDCRVEQAAVSWNAIPQLHLQLPESKAFLHTDLTSGGGLDLEKVER